MLGLKWQHGHKLWLGTSTGNVSNERVCSSIQAVEEMLHMLSDQ
jgi:hypothetical protein